MSSNGKHSASNPVVNCRTFFWHHGEEKPMLLKGIKARDKQVILGHENGVEAIVKLGTGKNKPVVSDRSKDIILTGALALPGGNRTTVGIYNPGQADQGFENHALLLVRGVTRFDHPLSAVFKAAEGYRKQRGEKQHDVLFSLQPKQGVSVRLHNGETYVIWRNAAGMFSFAFVPAQLLPFMGLVNQNRIRNMWTHADELADAPVTA